MRKQDKHRMVQSSDNHWPVTQKSIAKIYRNQNCLE